ncbi:MAG: NADH-quinone oxidoreductase subunit A [Acidimicrobiaceae bacterium]|nr:NADH-quinone oxidoreductase subunit A [Acidimicrobiaceae bacterium]MCY4279471.1 NADH-quinone oxidoreductase subunit A [Acidimicrobiaceae bacterium]MCY4293463.1 NADH-quinone oxidoreductase subunit A [Acidimicrobiaceae bacterium]
MLGQYLPLLALFALAALFAAGSFFASGLLAPRRATVAKLDPYECGIVPTRDTPERFPVRFFLVAMLFIVFDVEIVLFYPYAVAHGGLGLFGLVALLIFSFAVFESFVYLIGAGALEWGPAPRLAAETAETAGAAGTVETAESEHPSTPRLVSAGRTAGSTVRRVGLEGRGVPETVPMTPPAPAPSAETLPDAAPQRV